VTCAGLGVARHDRSTSASRERRRCSGPAEAALRLPTH
jgi:hypothetical protein